MARTKTPPAPKPITSGFCNPTLPRTAAYDPHALCRMSRCVCPCHQETTMPPIDPTDLAPAPDTRTLDGEMVYDDPADCIAAIEHGVTLLNEALGGGVLSRMDWTDAVRLLRALRKTLEPALQLDSSLQTHIYLNGEHGLHQHIEGIPGGVNITRGRAGEKWNDDACIQAVLDAHQDGGTGEFPTPNEVVDWIREAAAFGYWRKTPLREMTGEKDLSEAGLYESKPGRINVTFDA